MPFVAHLLRRLLTGVVGVTVPMFRHWFTSSLLYMGTLYQDNGHAGHCNGSTGYCTGHIAYKCSPLTSKVHCNEVM